MGGMRKIARDVAMSKSYQETHTTDMFDDYFRKYWREKGHPAGRIINPTKKKRKKRCKR